MLARLAMWRVIRHEPQFPVGIPFRPTNPKSLRHLRFLGTIRTFFFAVHPNEIAIIQGMKYL